MMASPLGSVNTSVGDGVELGYAFDAVLVALALADVHVVYVVLVEDDLALRQESRVV